MTIMLHKIVFYVSLITSVGLLVAGFCVPPTGVIDPSVLTAVGELIGFVTVAQVPYVIDKGRNATIKHGNTEISISKKTKKSKDEQENQ